MQLHRQYVPYSTTFWLCVFLQIQSYLQKLCCETCSWARCIAVHEIPENPFEANQQKFCSVKSWCYTVCSTFWKRVLLFIYGNGTNHGTMATTQTMAEHTERKSGVSPTLTRRLIHCSYHYPVSGVHE